MIRCKYLIIDLQICCIPKLSVGYGDLAPRTAWGKVISATLALTGIPLIAIPLPLIMNKFKTETLKFSVKKLIFAILDFLPNDNIW